RRAAGQVKPDSTPRRRPRSQMLALTDSALARLAIAATRVDPRRALRSRRTGGAPDTGQRCRLGYGAVGAAAELKYRLQSHSIRLGAMHAIGLVLLGIAPTLTPSGGRARKGARQRGPKEAGARSTLGTAARTAAIRRSINAGRRQGRKAA